MLKIGDSAPQFSLPSDSDAKVSLSDFKGKAVVLFFYPKDMTSGCTQEACDFRDAFKQFKKRGVEILGISKDPVKKHIQFKEKNQLPFLLLSDEEGKVCEKYGVWKEKSLYGRKYMGIERTTFVIGPNGKITALFEKVKVKDHVAAVLELFS